MNTVWRSDNSDDHDNINRPVQISNVSQYLDAIKLPQVIYLKLFITPRDKDTDKVLSMIRGNESLGYWYHNTIYSFSHHPNDDEKNMEKKFLKCFEFGKACTYFS